MLKVMEEICELLKHLVYYSSFLSILLFQLLVSCLFRTPFPIISLLVVNMKDSEASR